MVDCVSINVCNKLASWKKVPLAYGINLSSVKPKRFLHLSKIIGSKLTFIIEAHNEDKNILMRDLRRNEISFLKWKKILKYMN